MTAKIYFILITIVIVIMIGLIFTYNTLAFVLMFVMGMIIQGLRNIAIGYPFIVWKPREIISSFLERYTK